MVYFRGGPTAQDETVLVKKAVNEPIVEFTFGNPVRSRRQSRLSRQHLFFDTYAEGRSQAPRKAQVGQKAVISEDQIPLFKIA